MARLTPRDIQEKEFSSGFRGYKEEDVDEFLDRITSSYEEVFKENIDLKEEVSRLVEENKKYELIGERMQAALVAAQETADDVRKNATKEAENILREAEIKAHKMVQESRDQHRDLQKSLAIVKQIEEEFRFKLKSTLQSYLKLLDEVAIGDNKEIKQWIMPEDMAALGERRRAMEEKIAPVKKEEKPAEAPAKGTGEPEQAVKKEAPKAEIQAPPAAIAPAKKAEEAPAKKADEAEAKKIEEPASKKAEETTAKKADEAEAKKIEEPASKKAEEAPQKEASQPETIETKKPEDTGPAVSKEAIVEDSKAKAAALLDEIAAQAAEEKKAEEAKAAAASIPAKTTEAPAQVKAPAKEEQPAAKETKPEVKEAKSEVKEAKTTEAPFDQKAGEASAVSAEWAKLQEAVDEAVKATDKPSDAEKEAAAAESTMPGEMVESKAAKIEETPPDQAENKPKAKDETIEAKSGKPALEDIEIVEDESFWKDI